MEYITLGRTNEKVSRISLGTWSYGGPNTLSGNCLLYTSDAADE